MTRETSLAEGFVEKMEAAVNAEIAAARQGDANTNRHVRLDAPGHER